MYNHPCTRFIWGDEMRKILSAVAAIIENKNQEILCALRSPKMSIPNHREYPGDKIQESENPAFRL